RIEFCTSALGITNRDPTKTTGKRKRTVEKVIAEIPPLESVKFLPMETPHRDPILNLPTNIDITSPYALFTLFFTEECSQNISDSTNLYAKLKRDNGDTDNEAPELSGAEEEEEDKDIPPDPLPANSPLPADSGDS
ncbi:hypothetical protein ACJ73_10178, partial [Blastomyces percursus]